MQWAKSNVVLVAFYVVLCFIATSLLIGKITDRPLDPDAMQNVRTASHLANFGIYSYQQTEPPTKPTMKREPIPIFALAALILLNETTANARPFEKLYEGEPLRILKQINLFWTFLAYAGICVLVFLISANIVWRVVVPPAVLLLTNYSFMDIYVNRLTTEAVALAVLVWGAVAMLVFVRAPSRRNAIVLGIALACCALTKAALFYVSIFAVLTTALLFYMTQARSDKETLRRLRATFGVLLISFLAVVGVWVARNAIEKGQFRIADRGGDIFYFRVLLMKRPLLGSVYAFSPRNYREWMGKLTGYTVEDLKEGGELEYVKKKRWGIYRDMMRAEGIKISRSNAQAWLTRKAVTEYLHHPSYYLIWPAVFAYRGSFFLTPGKTATTFEDHLSLLLVINFLVIGIASLVRRDLETYAVFVMPLGLYLFHALVTHSLVRYNEPLTPFVWLAAAYTLFYFLSYLPILKIQAPQRSAA